MKLCAASSVKIESSESRDVPSVLAAASSAVGVVALTIAARAEANWGSNEVRKASAPSRPVTASKLASVWLSATGSVGF